MRIALFSFVTAGLSVGLSASLHAQEVGNVGSGSRSQGERRLVSVANRMQ